MNEPRPLPVLVLVAFLVSAAGAVVVSEAADEADDPEIFTCTDNEGNVVYQTDPCPVVKADRPPPRDARKEPEPHPPPLPAPLEPKPRSPATPRPAVKPRPVRPAVAAAPRPPAVSTNPRYASPERTWQTFTEAMRTGDRTAALACLSSPDLEPLGSLIRSVPPPALRATLDALGKVESAGPAGPFWSLRVTRETGPSKWIFLERAPNGDWKIGAF